MTTVAVLGAGAGGAAVVTELTLKGLKTHFWNRSPAALQPFIDNGSVMYDGVLGEGSVVPDLMSGNLQEVLENVDGIVVCMPTLAHADIATALANLGASSVPVILNPGHTGGALEFHQSYIEQGVTPPPLAEFSTLTYVARKYSPATVSISGTAKQVRVAGMAGDTVSVDFAQALYPNAFRYEDVIATSLSNVNLVLHPPGCILGAAWVEASGGDFTFYVEGMTQGVGRVVQQLDDERLQVAAAFGHKLPSVIDEMLAIGTIDQGGSAEDFAESIRRSEANQKIKAPNSLSHRYYAEDFWYGLSPFIALADVVQVPVPVARSLMTIAVTMKGKLDSPRGRSAQQMGISGFQKQQIIDLVRGNQ